MIFEVCTNSVESAKNAEAAGAHRVELCAALEIGGITPSHAAIRQSLKELSIDVHVLIRARGGNFVYSPTEIEIMKQDVIFCREAGVHGVVIGALNNDGTIQKEFLKEVVDLAKPMKVAFHRAFDRAANPTKALDCLIDCGVDILLTSGQKGTALEGIKIINNLIDQSNGRIEIMPGCGVDEKTIGPITRQANIKSIHFTGKRVKEDDIFIKKGFEDSSSYWETDEEIVRKTIAMVDAGNQSS